MKLVDILKELSEELMLQPGHASSKSSSDLGIEGMIDILSVKNMRKYDYQYDDNALPLVEPLVNDLLAKGNVVGEEGQYKLFLVTKSGKYKLFLVNTKAPTTDLVFVGIIELEKMSEGFTYNTQKAFDLKIFQVHWSNVGAEYRGKGLGKILYTLVYNYVSSLGAALASDSMLYEGSSGMWRTYMPSIASYFGIIIDDILLPVTKDDVTNTTLVDRSGLDGFVAMENPPKLIRKIAHNVEGLSFAKGEYGVIALMNNINDNLEELNDQRFEDVIDDFDSLKQVAIKFGKYNDISSATPSKPGNLKCLILAFEDAIVAVKQVGDRIVIQLI